MSLWDQENPEPIERLCPSQVGNVGRGRKGREPVKERENSFLAQKEQRLREIIRETLAKAGDGRVFVGFSGGVDSSLLLWESVQALGSERITAVTATSPTSIPEEEESARRFAANLNVTHLIVPTSECDDAEFISNPWDRCYRCKHIRFNLIKELSKQAPGSVIFDGTQSDDAPEDRPGMRALAELNISSPLAEAGIGKREVREFLRKAGFSDLAEKNAQPCLATRIPVGHPITLEALEIVRRGESFLKECGLTTVRLRHHESLARIVTDSSGISLVLAEGDLRQKILAKLKELGYQYVTVDLEAYGKTAVRSGSR
jgi:pyridinium-3,5-biscarboxylic acid mononucleotide sulfurtransferase